MKQFLLRMGNYIVVFVVLSIFLFLSFNCIESPLEPVAPTYDTQLSVPIIDKTYYLRDAVSKDTVVKQNVDGTLYYNTIQHGTPRQIDTIDANPDTSSQQVALGEFSVADISMLPTNFLVSDIGIIPGSYPSFPSGSFSIAPMPINDTDHFDYVAISSGTLNLTIINNLPVPIDFPEPIILRNNWSSPSDTSSVAQFPIPNTINPGDSITIPSDLTGKLLRGILTTDSIRLHTSGSGSPVTINTADGISVSFQSTTLWADSAMAVIPNQRVYPAGTSIFMVDDSIMIEYASFSSGSFVIEVNNNLEVSAQVQVKINEMWDLNTQDTLRYINVLSGREIRNIPVSADRLLVNNATVFSMGTYLNYSVGIEIIDSQGEKKLVTRNDLVSVELRPNQPLIIKSITGKIPPKYMDLNSRVVAEFDLGEAKETMTGQLLFENVTLGLYLPMTGGAPFDYVNLRLIAEKNGLLDSIIIPNGRVNPGLVVPPINLSSAPNFDSFINFLVSTYPNLPDSFFVRGQLILSPTDVFLNDPPYTLDDTSKVYPWFDMDFPSMAIAGGQITKVQESEAKAKVDQSVSRQVIEGDMNFTFTNRIPLAIKYRMVFFKWNEAGTQREILHTIAPPDSIKASDIDVNRIASTPQVSSMRIHLTGDEFYKVTDADSVLVQFDLETSSNGTTPIKLHKDDYVRVQASANSRISVNKP